MPDLEWLEGGVTAVPGILASGVTAGIKPSGKKDLALIHSPTPARSAAVFTSNQVKGAPVLVSRASLTPCSPVQTFAHPLEATMAWARPSRMCSWETRTGAPLTWLVVKTAAARAGAEE